MSSVRRLDGEKLRTRRIIVTAMLTVVTVAFLLLTDTSAPVSAAPAAQGPSVQAAGMEVPADPAEAPPGQAPGEPAAPYQNPDDPTGAKKVQTASTARPGRPQKE
jgi:hypothetical protein